MKVKLKIQQIEETQETDEIKIEPPELGEIDPLQNSNPLQNCFICKNLTYGIKYHIFEVHIQMGKFGDECKTCETFFANFKKHMTKEFECESCAQVLKEIREHLGEKHEPKDCNVCESLLQDLVVHSLIIHECNEVQKDKNDKDVLDKL